MDTTSCPICLDRFARGRDVSAVQCGHVFHADCLSRWMEDHITCPQCRQMTTHTDIIPKLFISFSDATIVHQLKAVTAKLKHREQQQLAQISLDCFASGRDVSAVWCGHVFHADCLSRWMENHLSCPQCLQLATHYDIIPKLFISFSDAMTAKLKHTEQVPA